MCLCIVCVCVHISISVCACLNSPVTKDGVGEDDAWPPFRKVGALCELYSCKYVRVFIFSSQGFIPQQEVLAVCMYERMWIYMCIL
jgi:hypothetical protein